MKEETLFHQAIALESPEERKEFLDRACGSDSRLRAEVESLVQHHQQAEKFLEQPPAALLGTIRMSADETISGGRGDRSLCFLEDSDTPGSLGKLGGYEILEVIGRGGMGMVLKARDAKLNRVVAIKAMAGELAVSETSVKRFLREAQSAAAVRHENVVTIHAVHDDGPRPYLVMEMIDGPSLQQRLDEGGPIELEENLRIGQQVAAGLDAAHRRGLIHRDIKPANILLESGSGKVKITDFGLARAIDDVSLTQAGQLAGTPQYMSPEQAQGQPLDARSDLFSLGSLLYTLSFGQPAFGGESLVATIRSICDFTPRHLVSTGASDDSQPDWLKAIIGRLMEKDPQRRFQTAGEVADWLGRHLEQLRAGANSPVPRATTATFPNARDRAGARSLYRRLAAGIAAAAGVAMVVAGVVLIVVRPDGSKLKINVPAGASATVRPDGEVEVVLPSVAEAAAWSDPIEIGITEVNWGLHLSADGLSLFYAAVLPGGEGDIDLWMRQREAVGKTWSPPINVGSPVNSPASESAPTLSADGLALVFESQREGGLGASDLWISTRAAPDQPWMRPVNLGGAINDSAWQRAPTLSADGQMLIYSTTYPDRFGNKLVMATRDKATGEWTPAVPVEVSVPGEESYQTPALSSDGLTLFFSVGRESQERLYFSTRRTIDAPWSAPNLFRPQPPSHFVGETFPTLAADGQSMLYLLNSTVVQCRRVKPAAEVEK